MRRLGAAAIALLLAQTPVLHARAQTPLTYAQPLSQAAAAVVQQRLKQTGNYAGPTDGMWGPESDAALQRFQRAQGLQVTGQLNPATVATLGLNPADLLANAPPSPPPVAAIPAEPLAPEAIRNIQGRLRQLGFYTGQVDGIWGPTMQAAIERFQQGRGLQATGQLTPATITALGLDPNHLTAPVR